MRMVWETRVLNILALETRVWETHQALSMIIRFTAPCLSYGSLPFWQVQEGRSLGDKGVLIAWEWPEWQL